jgi:hypothetical protein
MSGWTTNGLPVATSLTGAELNQIDSQLPGGQSPQSEAVSLNRLVGFAGYPFALAYAATVTPDFGLNGAVQTITLTGNVTFANPANLQPGQRIDLIITQDGTGSRTASWGNLWTFSGGSKTLSTAANAVDRVSGVYDGVKIRAVLSTAYA